MRLILSRKGLDSAWGGVPSPILSDGRLVSVPIPEPEGPIDPGGGRGCGYRDILVDESTTFADLLDRLGVRALRYPTRGGVARLPPAAAGAHLDPDVRRGARPRPPGWRPLFGQTGAAQGHLARRGVGAGDLFLFFGWFRHVVADGGSLSFTGPDLHVLWGWLEVAEVVAVDDDTDLPWADGHPHLAGRDRPRYARGNTLYLARRRLRRHPTLPGAGTFPTYRDALRLTAVSERERAQARGRSDIAAVGATRRSRWSLPAALHPSRTAAPMSGNPPGRWRLDGDRALLDAAPRGQEFVVDTTPAIRAWVDGLLTDPGPCLD